MNANLRRQIRTIQAQSSCAFETVAGGAAGLRPSQFTLCALGGRHCVSVCVRVHTFVEGMDVLILISCPVQPLIEPDLRGPRQAGFINRHTGIHIGTAGCTG